MSKAHLLLIEVQVQGGEDLHVDDLQNHVKEFGETLQKSMGLLEDSSAVEKLTNFESLLKECDTMIEKISQVNLPTQKPHVFDETDAGPGAGPV